MFLAACVALLPIVGRCGAPFQTDDPNVVALGRVELLAFYQSTLDASGRSGTLIGLESHFGVAEGVELDFTTPIAFNTPSGEGTQRGFGDTIVGVKYRLVAESERAPLVSFVPKVVVPTGSALHGLGNGGSQIFLALAAETTRDRFQTYANGGYWINNGAGNRSYWFVGWEMQYWISERVAVGAEIFHATSQGVGRPASSGFNVGAAYVFDPHNQLLISAGRGIQNAAATNRVSAYAGYQISF